MKIVVLKFGGTSVANEEARQCAIGHVRKAREAGYAVVAVVSAMGRMGAPYATDTLLSLLRGDADPLTQDLLISCGETISSCIFADSLQAQGIPSTPMTGPQAGLTTDGVFKNAEITGMNPSHVRRRLAEGNVVVLTGFQGVTPTGETATLGRGGSDTSAVAAGGYLGAEHVDIFTDVIGIAKVDPRILPDAPFMDAVAYDDIHTLALFGAKVIHPRAVATARQHGVRVRVRSTFSDAPGTLLSAEQAPGLAGLALLKGCAVNDVPSELPLTENAAGPFAHLAEGEPSALITAVYHPLAEAKRRLADHPVFAQSAIYHAGRQSLHIPVPPERAEESVKALFTLLNT